MKIEKCNQNGITLIAVIITIIVMIILTATTITLSVGNNGLLNNSENATVKSYISQSKNIILEGWSYVLSKVDENEMPFEKYVEGTSDSSEKEKNQHADKILKKYLNNYGTGALIHDSNNNYVYSIKIKGKTEYINSYKIEFLLKGRPENEKKTFYIGIDNKVYYDATEGLEEFDEIDDIK